MQVKRPGARRARIVAAAARARGIIGTTHDAEEWQTAMNDRPGSKDARFPLLLLAVFLVVAVALGIAPHYRQDWLLENVLVMLALPALVFGFRRLRFSDASYAALFVFLVLHEIGAHYTYAEVPWDRWFAALSGFSLHDALGLSRNPFDRAIHFAYGLLLTPAVVELVAARTVSPGAWRFGGDLGEAYLGTQGDPWDAQQDMLLALLGSVVTVVVLAVVSEHRRRRAAASANQ